MLVVITCAIDKPSRDQVAKTLQTLWLVTVLSKQRYWDIVTHFTHLTSLLKGVHWHNVFKSFSVLIPINWLVMWLISWNILRFLMNWKLFYQVHAYYNNGNEDLASSRTTGEDRDRGTKGVLNPVSASLTEQTTHQREKQANRNQIMKLNDMPMPFIHYL